MKRSVIFGSMILAVGAILWALKKPPAHTSPTPSPAAARSREALEQMRHAANDVQPTKDTVIKPLPKFLEQHLNPRLLSAADPSNLPPFGGPARRPGEAESMYKTRVVVVAEVAEFEKAADLTPDQAVAVKKVLADIQIAYVAGMDEMRTLAEADRLGDNMIGLLDSLQSRMDVEFKRVLSQHQLDMLYGVPGKTPLGRFSSMRSAIAMSTRPFEMNERAIVASTRG
jgi:hypothetical protein